MLAEGWPSLRKNQKEILEIKNAVTETKNVFLDSLVDWTRHKEE